MSVVVGPLTAIREPSSLHVEEDKRNERLHADPQSGQAFAWPDEDPPEGPVDQWYGVYRSLCVLRLSRAFTSAPANTRWVVEDSKVDTLSFPPNLPTSVVLVLIRGKPMHYNALALDRQHRVLVWFEPLGYGSQQDALQRPLENIAKKHDAQLVMPEEYEPKVLQEDQPVCGAACLMFAEAIARASGAGARACNPPLDLLAWHVAHHLTEDRFVRYAAAITAKAVAETGHSVHDDGYWQALTALAERSS
jgi:hypothetical protein